MRAADLTGLFVPVVTPFDEADRIDAASLRKITEEALTAGAAGVVALATTGESPALTAAEREEVIGICAEVCTDHGAYLIVGAGTNSTRTTIEAHQQLADRPAVSASLAVVPYYVRPTEEAIVRHFELVAKESPVPLVIYNIPYRTGRNLTARPMLDLAANDNVIGLKQAVGGIDADTLAILAATPPEFAVLAGDDPFILPTVLLGGRGAIAASANVCTAKFAELVQAGLAGDLERGRTLAAELLPVVSALFAEPNPVVIKAVLAAAGRIATPNVRLPLVNATDAAARAAHAAVERAGSG